MPLRHIPQRTCVACRSLRPKREMVRVVRSADALDTTPTVQVDPTGKRSGRGAYLCRAPECWQKALRRQVLDRALKTELSATDRAALTAYSHQLAAVSGESTPSSRPDDTAPREPSPGLSATVNTKS